MNVKKIDHVSVFLLSYLLTTSPNIFCYLCLLPMLAAHGNELIFLPNHNIKYLHIQFDRIVRGHTFLYKKFVSVKREFSPGLFVQGTFVTNMDSYFMDFNTTLKSEDIGTV